MGIVGLLLLMMLQPHNPNKIEYDPSYHHGVSRFANSGLKSAFTSSVVIKAVNENGFLSTGSGNFFRIHNKTFIMTAAHVVENKDMLFVIERSGDLHFATTVMIDSARDVAIIVTDESLRYTKAIDYRPGPRLQVGTDIHYCGHPNSIEFTCYEGSVSGNDGSFILADMFAWPGSSGSVVFDDKGRVVGVVSALAVAEQFGIPVLLSHIVLMGPVEYYTRRYLLEILSDVKN